MTHELRRPPDAKRRTVHDLVQFVKTRTDGVANYALLLGAGASATSGVRTAGQLVAEWREDVYKSLCSDPITPYDIKAAKDWLWHHESHWYSPQREYSSLFEKKFDLPRQRRMFVEQEVDGKAPSLGYAYLIRLIEKRYFNATFTTNFDDLLNEAFHRFSDDRPIVCAHDSSISSITVTSKRPKIIKIHGDYLFDDIKSTQRETESLEENTKRKLVEFSKDHGLIVIGYSGHDRSVMDVLQHLLKQDEYLKHGIYWCLREGEELSEELLKLLWRERAYWVQIDGFDELMAELHQNCIGDALPVSTAIFSDKPKQIVRGFCDASHLRDSPSKIIKDHLQLLANDLEREALVESLRPLTVEKGDKNENRVGLSDSDLIKFLSIERLAVDRDFTKVRQRIAEQLAVPIGIELRTQLLELRGRVERRTNDSAAAMATLDELLQIDPNSADYLVLRAELETSALARMNAIERAIRRDPFYSRAYRKRATFRIEEWEVQPSANEQEAIRLILEDLEKSLTLQPSISNSSWEVLFDFIMDAFPAGAQRDSLIEGILERLAVMDAMHPGYLRLLVKQASEDKAKQPEALEMLELAIAEQPRTVKRYLEFVKVQALADFGRKQELVAEVQRLVSERQWETSAEFLTFRAMVLAKFEGKLLEAINVLLASPLHLTQPSVGRQLVQFLGYAKRTKEGYAVLNAPTQSFDHEERELLRAGLYEDDKLWDKALSIYSTLRRDAKFPYTHVEEEVHTLLKAGRWADAERLAREALKTMNFSPRKQVLIVNLELAVQRQNRKPDGTRLGRIASEEGGAAVCAHLLLEDKKRAETIMISEIEKDGLNVYVMNEWAIFDLLPTRAWFEQKLKAMGRHDELETVRARAQAANG